MALDAPQPDFSSLGELNVVSNPAGGHASPSEVMYPGGPQSDGGLLAPGDPLPENAGPGGRRPEWLKVRLGDRQHLRRYPARPARRGPQHRLRGGPLPEPGRVLGARHGHLHDPRQRLHAELRVLRHRHRATADHRLGRAAARGRGHAPDGPQARRDHHGRARRPARRRRRNGGGDDPPDPSARTPEPASRSSSATSTAASTTSAPWSRPSPTSSTTTSRRSRASRSRFAVGLAGIGPSRC